MTSSKRRLTPTFEGYVDDGKVGKMSEGEGEEKKNKEQKSLRKKWEAGVEIKGIKSRGRESGGK